MGSILKGVAVVLSLLLLFLLGGLSCAQIGIRQERPAMPDAAELLALSRESDRPIRLSWIKTATQSDPDSTIVHPVFVLEWSDGRTLLVDTGMSAEAAMAFGRPAELVLGSDPTVVGRSVDVALGSARGRLAGLVFTHLHTDHTQGIELLCSDGSPTLDVYMPPAQYERANYTTNMGLEPIESAPCARRVTIADEGLARFPGLGGVGGVRAAGHTPGSQMIVAWVGREDPRAYVFAGDVVFDYSQIAEDRPKPLVYRVLITPEADEQLGEVRRWLDALEKKHGFLVVPSHDLARIESLALPDFATPR